MAIGSNLVIRKYGPLLVSILCAMAMIIEFYIDVKQVPSIKWFADGIREVMIDTNMIAVFVGAGALLLYWYLPKLRSAKTKMDKFMALECIGLVVGSSIFGLVLGAGSKIYSSYIEYTFSAAQLGFGMSMWFWLAYLAYRSFRIRNLDGMVFSLGFAVVLIGLAPWGYIYMPPTAQAKDWLLNYISNPAYRALTIGGGLGAGFAAFRSVIGKEKVYLKGD